MKPLVFLALAALVSTSPALAADPAPKAKGADAQNVNITPVALPIIYSGRIVNYVFVNVRVDLAANANAPKLREKEPFFRDALVRAGHRTPFTLANDATKIDEAKLKQVMMREATAIAGAGQVRGITLVSQTPKTWRATPG